MQRREVLAASGNKNLCNSMGGAHKQHPPSGHSAKGRPRACGATAPNMPSPYSRRLRAASRAGTGPPRDTVTGGNRALFSFCMRPYLPTHLLHGSLRYAPYEQIAAWQAFVACHTRPWAVTQTGCRGHWRWSNAGGGGGGMGSVWQPTLKTTGGGLKVCVPLVFISMRLAIPLHQ